MRNRFLCLFLFNLFCISCTAQDAGIAVADDKLSATLVSYRKLDSKHRVKIASDDEPGERLIVMSRLISKETGKPIVNHTISLYQADVKGSYGEREAGDESTARISGEVTTDSEGRFMVATILPGDYGTTAGNRHIHLSVPEAKPAAYDFFFGDFMGTSLISWATRTDQAIILYLKKHDGILIAYSDLKVRGFALQKKTESDS